MQMREKVGKSRNIAFFPMISLQVKDLVKLGLLTLLKRTYYYLMRTYYYLDLLGPKLR